MRFIQGEYAGMKEQTITPKDTSKSAFTTHTVGVHINRANGFQGEKETVEVKLTRDAPIEEYRKLQPGEKVAIPFFITTRVWEGRAFVTHMTGDAPRVIK